MCFWLLRTSAQSRPSRCTARRPSSAGPSARRSAGRKQPIDDTLPGIGPFVVEKGLELIDSRRQPGQVPRDAPQQGGLVRLGKRRQAAAMLRSARNASIGFDMVAVVRGRVAAPGLGRPSDGGDLGRLFIGRAPDARGNPAGNEGDLPGGEGLPLGRHAAVILSGLDAADELARPRVARYENEPVVAPFAGERSRVEAKAGLLFECAVAGPAAGFEEGLDVARVVGRRRSTASGGRNRGESQRKPTARGRAFTVLTIGHQGREALGHSDRSGGSVGHCTSERTGETTNGPVRLVERSPCASQNTRRSRRCALALAGCELSVSRVA